MVKVAVYLSFLGVIVAHSISFDCCYVVFWCDLLDNVGYYLWIQIATTLTLIKCLTES